MDNWREGEQHVERAHEYFQAGRWEDAERELRRALERDPARADWHTNLGLVLAAAGRAEESLACYRRAFELNPEDGGTALLAGTTLLRLGRAEESIAWLEAAGRLEPGRVDSLVHRIDAYARLGRHEQAEVMFYLSQQIDAENAAALSHLARSLLDRGQVDRAIWCLREAARLEPRLPGVHARLAGALARIGRLERARELYLHQLRLDPGDRDTLMSLGRLLVDLHRLPEAAEKFRRVIELAPDDAAAHHALSLVAERCGHADEALAHVDVAYRLEPDRPGVRRGLARALLTAGGPGRAERAAELLAVEVGRMLGHPERFEPGDLSELGLLLLRVDLPGEAARALRRAVDLAPENVDAREALSVACFRSGERAAGAEHARQVVERDPSRPASLYNLALASAQEREWRRAWYWLRRGLRVAPDDARLRGLRFALRFRSFLGAWDSARRRIGAALRG